MTTYLAGSACLDSGRRPSGKLINCWIALLPREFKANPINKLPATTRKEIRGFVIGSKINGKWAIVAQVRANYFTPVISLTILMENCIILKSESNFMERDIFCFKFTSWKYYGKNAMLWVLWELVTVASFTSYDLSVLGVYSAELLSDGRQTVVVRQRVGKMFSVCTGSHVEWSPLWCVWFYYDQSI